MKSNVWTAPIKLFWIAVFAGVITLSMCRSASAQKVYEDVILLQTAEVLRGEITENNSPGDVTILLNDSTVRVVPRAEIVKILREVKRNFNQKETRAARDEKQEGNVAFTGLLQVGFGTKVDAQEFRHLRANFIAGIRAGRAFSLGIGAGVRAFTQTYGTAVPLFMDVRISSQNPKVAPILAVGAGTIFHQDADWENNGGLFYFEGGVRLGAPPGVGFIITLGFERFTALSDLERRQGGFLGLPYFARRAEVINAFTVNLAISF
ncbi:MAG: hypothetical protein ABR572_12670 [Cryomorphaceae bacterium]